MKKTRSFLLSAGIALALSFTLSCSSDPDEQLVGCPSGGEGNDINNYRTVDIGTQKWMASNLNYDVPGSKCYGNDPVNCAIYGRLYDWSTAMGFASNSNCNSISCASLIQPKHKGICPSGWHIPSDAEWTDLTNFVGSNPGTKLKAESECGWSNGRGIDQYKFSALPGGYGGSNGSFNHAGDFGGWWSASEYKEDFISAYFYHTDNSNDVPQAFSHKNFLYSIRCIQD